MSKWQPIETAPRDGAFFLAYQHSFYDIPFICKWADGNWRFYGEFPYIVSPDVWMPIPEPLKEMNEQ